MYFIPQVQEGDCGVACLKMILATLNKDKNYAYLPFKETSKSFSFKELIKLGSDNGLAMQGVKAENKEELYNWSNFPFIAALARENSNHAVVVTKASRKKVRYFDPEFGECSSSIEDFVSEWTGDALIVANHEKKSCKFQKEEIVSSKKIVVSDILQLLSGLLAILGVYFIKSDGDLMYPIIFLSASLIMTILMKSYTIGLMKKADNYIIERSEQVKSKDLFNYYKYFELHKGDYLSSSMNIIYYVLVSIFMIFIVVFNGLSNYLLIMIPILLLFMSSFFINPYLKREKSKISKLEAGLQSEKDVSNFNMKVNQLHELSYKYSKALVAKKYLYFFIFALVAVLTSYISKEVSIINVVFNLFIEVYLYQNLDPIISYEENNIESMRNKIRFNNIIHQNNEIK